MSGKVRIAISILIVSFFSYSYAGGGSGTGWTSAKTWNGNSVPTWSHGVTVAVDGSGNYWPGGNFQAGDLKFATTTLTVTQMDSYAAKISSANAALFATKFNCAGFTDECYVTGSGVDSSGNIWFYVNYKGNMTIGTVNLYSPSSFSIAWAKLSSAGVVLLVGTSAGGTMVSRKMLIVGSKVYIVGSYTGAPSVGGTTLPTASSNEGFVIELSLSGVATNVAVTSASTGYTIIESLTIISGDIYPVGRYSNTAKFGSTTLSNGGLGNGFIAKLGSTFVWQAAFTGSFSGGSGAFAEFLDVESDALSNIVVTCKFQTGSGGTFNLGSKSVSSLSYDALNIIVNPSLTVICVNQAFSSGGKGVALAKDNTGAIWNTGVVQGNANFSGTLVNSPNRNTYLAKVSTSCAFSNVAYSTSSTGESIPSDMAISSTNKIVIVGDLVGTVSFASNSASSVRTALSTAVYTI